MPCGSFSFEEDFMRKQIAHIERWAPVLGAGALTAFALRRHRRSPLAGALALGAAALLLHGSTTAFRGRWPLPEGARPAGSTDRNAAEEAFDGSFPASDPPSSTPAWSR
jgi:hypothetical protein